MAVAFNSVSNSSFQNNTAHSSLSATHTAAGDDRYVVVIHQRRGSSAPTSYSVTYDGTAMTELISVTNGVSGVTIFGLADPSTTAGATVSASWTNDQIYGQLTVISFTGVDNTVGDTDTNGSTSAQTTAIALTGFASGDMAVDGFASSGGNAANDPTVGADQTTRGNIQSEAGFKSGASTQTADGNLEWDNIETDQVNQAGVVLKQLSAGYQEPRNYAFIIS